MSDLSESVQSPGLEYHVHDGQLVVDNLSPEQREEVMLNALNDDLREMGADILGSVNSYNRRARIYKAMHQLSEGLTLALTTTAGFIIIFDTGAQDLRYAAASLCFSAAGLRTAMEVFGIHKRAISIKKAAVEISKIKRDVTDLALRDLDYYSKLKKYNKLCDRLDDLRLQVFSSDLARYSSPVSQGSAYSRYSKSSQQASMNPGALAGMYNV